MRKYIWQLLLVCSLSVTSIAINLQSQSDTDPTPAPTKTTISPESTSSPETGTNNIEPFTQSDLNVLTGNVQRPNGIAWHNENLYAVCNGDWTLYELDDTNGDTETYIFGVRNAHTLHIETTSETEFDLWIPDYDVNALLRVNRIRAPEQIATGLEGPWGIVVFDEQTFLITNIQGNNLVSVTKSGEVTQLIDGLRAPTGLAINEDFVFLANNGSARRSIEWVLREELSDGESEPVLQPLVNGLQNTTGLLLADDGYLYFSYAIGRRGVIGRINPVECMDGGCTNDQVEIVVYTELDAPLAGMTISPDMRLYFHTIFRPEIYWIELPESVTS